MILVGLHEWIMRKMNAPRIKIQKRTLMPPQTLPILMMTQIQIVMKKASMKMTLKKLNTIRMLAQTWKTQMMIIAMIMSMMI